MIEGGVKLFVCAIGIPPQEIVDKLHKNGILCEYPEIKCAVTLNTESVVEQVQNDVLGTSPRLSSSVMGPPKIAHSSLAVTILG